MGEDDVCADNLHDSKAFRGSKSEVRSESGSVDGRVVKVSDVSVMKELRAELRAEKCH